MSSNAKGSHIGKAVRLYVGGSAHQIGRQVTTIMHHTTVNPARKQRDVLDAVKDKVWCAKAWSMVEAHCTLGAPAFTKHLLAALQVIIIQVSTT